MGAAWLISQRQGNVTSTPETLTLLCVHSERQAPWALLEWAQNTWRFVSGVPALLPAYLLNPGTKTCSLVTTRQAPLLPHFLKFLQDTISY